MTDSTLETATPLPAKPVNGPWWGQMETLWLWMAPLCALLFALTLPLSPNDLWYHIRAGEFISRGSIPTQNGMSLAVPLETPFYYQSWLAELGLYLTLKVGGLSGLMLLRAFFLGASVLLVAIATFRALLRLSRRPSRLTAARVAALCALIGFAISSSNVDLRPQVFSSFLFGVWIFAVLEMRASIGKKRSGWGIFLVLLTGLWANTHGAFAVSILGLGALALGDLLTRHERTRFSMTIAVASLAAVLINPRGFGLLIYVAQLSNNEIGQRFIQEWKSPGFNEWHSILFWSTGAGTLMWAALRLSDEKGQWQPRGELLALVLYFIMGARDQRAMIWFALWMPVVLAPLMVKPALSAKTEPPVPKAARFANAFILAMLMLAPLGLFPGVKAGLPWPDEFRKRFAPTPASLFPNDPPLLLENTTAVKAAEFLKQSPPRGKLFTDMVCGSYLTWATYPKVYAWCDPRIELFSTPFWEDYVRLSAGPKDAVAKLEAQGFTDALVDRENQQGLVRELRTAANWDVVAESGTTILFRHNRK